MSWTPRSWRRRRRRRESLQWWRRGRTWSKSCQGDPSRPHQTWTAQPDPEWESRDPSETAVQGYLRSSRCKSGSPEWRPNREKRRKKSQRIVTHLIHIRKEKKSTSMQPGNSKGEESHSPLQENFNGFFLLFQLRIYEIFSFSFLLWKLDISHSSFKSFLHDKRLLRLSSHLSSHYSSRTERHDFLCTPSIQEESLSSLETRQ